MSRASLAIAMLLFVSAPVQAAEKWYTAETSEFIVIGDAPKKQVSEVLEAIEVYRFITSRFAILRKPAPYKPRIFVLNSDSFRRYTRQRQHVVGFVKPSDFEMDIVVDSRSADNWMSNSQIVQHELTHFYLRLNARATVLPVWYDEGLAEFFSTVNFKGKKARIGDVPVVRFFALRNLPWLPLPQVLSLDRSAPEYNGHRLGESFYAQSWLLVHYSMLKEPTLAPALEKMMLNQGVSIELGDAMKFALGPRADTLEAELRRYSMGSAWPYRYFERPAESLKTATLQDLDAESGRAELGALLVRLNNRSDEDLEKDISALMPLARSAEAAAVKAMSKLAIGQNASADPYLQLCESSAQTSRALRYCALSWMTREFGVNNEDERAGYRRKATTLARRALQMDPDNFAAINLLLHSADAAGENVAELFSPAEQALEKIPSSFTLRLSLAKAYFDAGRFEDAQRHLEHAALHEPDPTRRDIALGLLRNVENAMAAKEKRR